MTPENVMDLAHSTLIVTSMIAAPLLLIALIAGLVIGMLQAATQINEATLTFVPKVLGAAAVLAIAGPWMVTTLVEYLQRTLQSIPSAVG